MAAQLATRWDVDEDGACALAQSVDDVRAVLEYFVEHVAHPAGEAAPVGEDKDRQLLAAGVADGLRGLKRRVGVPICIVMAYLVMVYMVMAYLVMAYMVTA